VYLDRPYGPVAGQWCRLREDGHRGHQQDSGEAGPAAGNAKAVHERSQHALQSRLDLVDDLDAGHDRGVCGGRLF